MKLLLHHHSRAIKHNCWKLCRTALMWWLLVPNFCARMQEGRLSNFCARGAKFVTRPSIAVGWLGLEAVWSFKNAFKMSIDSKLQGKNHFFSLVGHALPYPTVAKTDGHYKVTGQCGLLPLCHWYVGRIVAVLKMVIHCIVTGLRPWVLKWTVIPNRAVLQSSLRAK